MSANVDLRSVKVFFLLFFLWLNAVLGMPSSPVNALEPLAAEYGRYQIVACDQSGCNGITGVGPVDPQRPALQPVQLNLGAQQTWSIRKVHDSVYDLRIAGYISTGVKGPLVAGDSVYASIVQLDNLEWRIIRRADNKYTIHSAKDEGLVWTVTPEKTPNPYIIMDRIQPYFVGQLFRVIAVDS